MKKIFKKIKLRDIIFTILGLVIGGGIFGTLGIVATTNRLEAKYVMYTKDGETMTVQDAIKDLYVKANKGNNQTLTLGDVTVVRAQITIPYTGSYDTVRCLYGTDENYGSVGTISGNACTFFGDANTTYYYKLVATNNAGIIYENSGNVKMGSDTYVASLNLGDYIYMKPTKTSYPITSNMTGCTTASNCGGSTTQTINPSELSVWRVIRKHSDGTVDVVSENVSSTKVTFVGQTGYQNFTGTLNTIAAQYTDNNYVQSTRHMGYSNQTQNITNTSKLTQTIAPWTSSTSTSTTSADEKLGAGDMGYITDRELVQTALGTLVAKNPSGTASVYGLASRYYQYYNTTSFKYYGLGVTAEGGLCNYGLLSSDNMRPTSGPNYAIRPILTLKSTVKIVGGTGTAGDNYKLGL